MITLNTNLSSLIVQSNLAKSTNGLNRAVERMTTGYKVNHAKDNAANYSISTNLTTKINAYNVADENASMGLNLLTTASDSLSIMSDYVSKLHALATQANNGTYSAQSLAAINSEANAIIMELYRIQNNTSYNGIDLFGGKLSGATEDIGVDQSQIPKANASGFIEDVVERDTSAMTALSSVTPTTTISGGTYSISSAEELKQLADMTNAGKITGGEFVLGADIDLSAYSTGEGWTPIGTNSNQFKGNFDGNGHKIKNLHINRPTADNQGLFGYVASGKTLKNVGIENCNINGKKSVGGLVGYAYNSTITNCYATGDVTGQGQYAGGLAGSAARGTVMNCYTAGDIIGQGNNVGGLVGYAIKGTITNCYATGDVTGQDSVGGLVGNANMGTITNSYATGDIIGQGDQVGGLVGYAYNSTITNCYATGDVTGQGQSVGGLVGNAIDGTITNCYAIGDVTGQYYVGGLAGDATDGTITNCYATGDVTGQGNFVGGLAGSVGSGTITNCIVYGKVSGTTNVGIIAGYDTASTTIQNCSYDGSSNAGLELTGSGLAGTIENVRDMAVVLQVGINGDDSSQIKTGTAFNIGGIAALAGGLENPKSLQILDKMLNKINAKQVELGASQNRLESVLEQIAVSRESLVSSRSTIKDADVAKESSEYIRNQILQQAAATLLATANQAPGIALQLI